MVHSDTKSVSTPVPDMSALIARLEAAEAGSRELDREIGEVTRAPMGNAGDVVGLGYAHFTTSLDAALALLGRALPDWDWQITKGADEMALACIQHSRRVSGPEVCAHTPALALCIAILKAKAQGEGGHG